MDGHIVQSLNEKHLCNILGPKCNSNIIAETVNDVYVKVKKVYPILSMLIHKLVKSYCLSLYGIQ
jgi:hypothetical protein